MPKGGDVLVVEFQFLDIAQRLVSYDSGHTSRIRALDREPAVIIEVGCGHSPQPASHIDNCGFLPPEAHDADPGLIAFDIALGVRRPGIRRRWMEIPVSHEDGIATPEVERSCAGRGGCRRAGCQEDPNAHPVRRDRAHTSDLAHVTHVDAH